MGNAIWIFLGIAIVQAIVGGIAKSAEKRKKAEAAQRMLEGGGSDGTDPASAAGTPPMDTRAKSNASAQRRLEEARASKRKSAEARLEALRKRRLEVLRRRSGLDGGVTAAVDPNAGRGRKTSVKPPPPAAKPRVEATRQQPVRNQPTRATKPAPVRSPAKSGAAANPPKSRVDPRKTTSSARALKPVAPAAARRSSSARKAGASGSTAEILRGRLRRPGGFREALLLGELLKPPVGLRPPGDEVG